jgi:hypothetical protein
MFLRQILVLPSVLTIYQQIVPRLDFANLVPASLEMIPAMVNAWRNSRFLDGLRYIEAVLRCDAAGFKATDFDRQICKNCFAFLVLPIDPMIHSFPVHLYLQTSTWQKFWNNSHYRISEFFAPRLMVIEVT